MLQLSFPCFWATHAIKPKTAHAEVDFHSLFLILT